MKTRNMLEAVGAALLLVPFYLPFLPPKNHAIYHHGLPITRVMGGLLVDMLAIAVLTAVYLMAAGRLRRPLKRILEALFAGLMLWSIAGLAIQVMTEVWFPSIDWGRAWGKSIFFILPFAGLMGYLLPRVTDTAVRAVRLGVAAFAFTALWIVPQLVHLAMTPRPVMSTAAFHPPAAADGLPARRIVWILFDELSYDQTFEHPAASVQLPNFDRLRAQSVSFSDLQPAGYFTNRIIPSLILGRPFHQFRSTIDGRLSYWDESRGQWAVYDADDTLFGLAQRSGWNSGVDGWFNPYCRVLQTVLNVCNWYPGTIVPTEEYGASEQNSALANAAAMPNQLLAVLARRAKTPAEEHIEAYRSVMAHTQELIGDNRLGFVFLHLPAPHPPGIYDRRRHMLRAGGTYLDNLVLADDTLGVLLREIYASPMGSRTTVIISSDHSWRIPMWRPAAGWSEEEERASGGRFDTRPVLLIHFPGQASGKDVPAALPEMIQHDLIAAMLRGRMNDPEELATYLAQHGGSNLLADAVAGSR